jgi:hypothetical protein
MIKKVKMSRPQAMELIKSTYVISNNRTYTDVHINRQNNGEGIIDMFLLTKRNDNQLNELFGKCTFATNEWEFYTRAWVVEFEKRTFVIYSSGKGSGYEIVTDAYWESFTGNVELGELMIRFTDEMLKLYKTLGSNQEYIEKCNNMMKKVTLKG